MRNSQKSVKMATQTNQHSAEHVALTFVSQYYFILQNYIDQAHRFYKESSVLSWPQSDGKIKSVTTSEDLNEFITTSHFKNNKVQVTTIDSQLSIAGGVLAVVTANLIGEDNSKKSFSQTFFLAPQEKGYYVLNDIFQFIGVKTSSAVIEEKVYRNTSIAPLATDQEGFDKSETEVAIDNQVWPSITSSEKQKSVAETILVIENETPKVSYASMIKQGKSLPPNNAPYNIVRCVAESTPKRPQTLKSSSSDVSKVAAPSTYAEKDYYDETQNKSIFIGGLPTNTTISDLYDVVKQFGPVHTHDVQLKTYDDGYCCGFVHFRDAVSAQNAVQANHIIVKGKEVPITFKRLNKGRGERANFSSDEFRSGGFESGNRT